MYKVVSAPSLDLLKESIDLFPKEAEPLDLIIPVEGMEIERYKGFRIRRWRDSIYNREVYDTAYIKKET